MRTILNNLGRFLLARAQERSTVAGAVAVISTALGIAFPAEAIINTIVGITGLLAIFMPGGK